MPEKYRSRHVFMILSFMEVPEKGKTTYAAATVQGADGKASGVTGMGIAVNV